MALPTPTMVDSTNGVRVALHDFGGPVGADPILICHATGFLAAPYLPVARHFARTHRVFGLDMRGHGDSEVPEGVSMDWWGMVADVSAVAAVIGSDRLGGFGHSMGGAALLGSSLLDDTFVSAYVFEPIVFPLARLEAASPEAGEPRPNHMVEAARKRRREFDSFDAAYERYASRPPLSIFDPEVLRLYVDEGFAPTDRGTVELKCTPETEASVFEHSQLGLFDRLADITMPVHVAAGVLDVGPPEIAPLVADALANATFERNNELTHFGPFEAPEVIATAALEIFAR
jgi:pimeloyl-ACP methyl ester carboxylesterase